jgi:hypothetical protein
MWELGTGFIWNKGGATHAFLIPVLRAKPGEALGLLLR